MYVLTHISSSPSSIDPSANADSPPVQRNVRRKVSGSQWNDAVIKCTGDGHLLFLHPDEYFRTPFGSPAPEDDDQQENNSNSNFASLAKPFGDRVRHAIGGVMLNAQKKATSFNAMPGGIRSPAGARLPAFGTPLRL